MSIIKIVNRQNDQRYWVVRAQGGDYIPHFRQAGVVAIGHLDNLDFGGQSVSPFFPDLDGLQSQLMSVWKIGSDRNWKSRSHNAFRQVRAFLAGISVGDLVVSIDSGRLMIGRVVGHPEIDYNPVRVVNRSSTEEYSEMHFSLRRRVKWGPMLKRSDLPTAMKRSISARQTVFNVDKYWESIYHLIYPVFLADDRVYFSTRINQKSSINNYSVSKLFLILSELEVFVKSIGLVDNANDIDFGYLLNCFLSSESFELCTTAEFMSPGSVWSYLGVSDKTGGKLLVGALLFGAMFGAEVGPVKIDGILHKEVREKLLDAFLARLEHHKFDEIKNQLELSIPNHKTEVLEDSSQDSLEDRRAMALRENYEG